MNQKITIGIVVVIALAAALALPVMNSINKEASSQQQVSSAPIPPLVSPTPPPSQPLPPPPPPQPAPVQEPLVWEGTYEPPPKSIPQYQQQRQAGGKPQKDAGPALTAETLVGTAWQVGSPYGHVVFEVGANGQAIANHPMVGQLPATWRVQGDKVVVSASFMGQSMTIDAKIQGQTLVAPGQEIIRMR